MLFRSLVVAGLGCLVGLPLFAQDETKSREDFFKELDVDGDGQLTKDELGEKRASLFNRLVTLGDDNKDEKLSQEEFIKALNPPQPKVAEGNDSANARREAGRDRLDAMFKGLDTNNDGKVSKTELPAPLQERMSAVFERAGKDELTQEEFGRALAAVQPRPEQQGRRFSPDDFFARLDTNKDGKIVLDEVPEEMKRFVTPMFERLDKTELTKADIQQAMEQFQRGRRPEGDRPEGEMRRPGARRPPGEGGGPGPAFLTELDKNSDGKLSPVELAYAVTLIEKLDRNGDGELDGSELFGGGRPPGGPGMADRRPGEGRPDGDRPDGGRPNRPRRPEGARVSDDDAAKKESPSGEPRRGRDAPGGDGFAARFFEQFDTNDDGKVSKDEAPERMKENFDRIDANKDGEITKEELTEASSRRSPNRD